MSVMRVFARNMATASKINNVVVIGGGLMGSGIAQVSNKVPVGCPNYLKCIHWMKLRETESGPKVIVHVFIMTMMMTALPGDRGASQWMI